MPDARGAFHSCVSLAALSLRIAEVSVRQGQFAVDLTLSCQTVNIG